MMAKQILAVLVCCATASSVFAKSIWVLQGLGGTLLPPCQVVLWWPRVVFHNRSANDLTVLPLHESNQLPGAPQPAFVPVTIPAGTSVTLFGASGPGPVAIVQYEVPDGLGLEGRMELQGASICSQLPAGPFETKLRMPVFTRLVPAGEEQVHYGTDLASSEVRINVGIYNAGTVWANAAIKIVHPECPAATLTQSAVIPPDTFMQVGLPRVPPCGSSSAYTVVVVDQPSLSLVSTLVNGKAPGATAAVTSGD